jgi:hypothetical protein
LTLWLAASSCTSTSHRNQQTTVKGSWVLG